MRILHLDSGREMRGGQWQVLYLLRGLRDRGHDVHLLARRNAPLLQSARAENFDAAPLALPSFAAASRTARVLHAHDARTHAMAAFCATPSVVSRRVAFDIRGGPLSRWKYRHCDAYIAISQFVASRLISAGLPSSAITVVYDSVAPAPNGYRTGGNIVAPATGDPMKGSDLLQEAARLAGVKVRFSSDLTRDLIGAGMFVYITRQEGLGSAALVAMAHGVPVVASRVGGLPEIVEDGATGILVDNHPKCIAEAIARLLGQPDLAAAMGAEGRKRAANHSIDRMVDETIQVYERVLTND